MRNKDAEGHVQEPHSQGTELYLQHLSQTNCYHLDGRLKIDNNGAKNQIRDITLGRKNWLFSGTDSSAEDAAVIYSMMACCKAANVGFRQWLVFFLNNVHQYDQDLNMDLANLLPYIQHDIRVNLKVLRTNGSPLQLRRSILKILQKQLHYFENKSRFK